VFAGLGESEPGAGEHEGDGSNEVAPAAVAVSEALARPASPRQASRTPVSPPLPMPTPGGAGVVAGSNW